MTCRVMRAVAGSAGILPAMSAVRREQAGGNMIPRLPVIMEILSRCEHSYRDVPSTPTTVLNSMEIH